MKIIKAILRFLVKGSGLESDRPLLLWHPVVLILMVVITAQVIGYGIYDTAKEWWTEIVKRNRWRVWI